MAIICPHHLLIAITFELCFSQVLGTIYLGDTESVLGPADRDWCLVSPQTVHAVQEARALHLVPCLCLCVNL